MRIKLWESFNNDDDSEMIFIDLLDADLEVKFGEYDNNTTYVDIIKPQKWRPGPGWKDNLDINLVEGPILNWIELTAIGDYNWWLETPCKHSSGLYKTNNLIWNKEYLKDVLLFNTQLRVVISKNSEYIESFFTNLAEDYFINFNYRENQVYITKKINYEEERFNGKYRRQITGQFEPVATPQYRGDNKLKYLRNEKTWRPVNVETEVESYKKIFYALESDLQNLKRKCRFEVQGKDFIIVNFNKDWRED